MSHTVQLRYPNLGWEEWVLKIIENKCGSKDKIA